MNFHVIAGGLTAEGRTGRKPEDVHREAARRLRELGYERLKVRHLVTGEPIPRALEYLKMQMTWVAETLAAIDPIPADFTDDRYWPKA